VFDVLGSGFMRVSLDQVQLKLYIDRRLANPIPTAADTKSYNAIFFIIGNLFATLSIAMTALRRYYLDRNTPKSRCCSHAWLEPERSCGARAEGFLPNCCPGSSRFCSLHYYHFGSNRIQGNESKLENPRT